MEYKINTSITTEQFIELLNASTLGERRPVADQSCMAQMIKNTNLCVSAWDGDSLVGIARSMTDFAYACYLSDLAVSKPYQRKGIGKQLIHHTQAQLGPKCSLMLLAAPQANAYYEKLGMTNNPRCWVLRRDARVMD